MHKIQLNNANTEVGQIEESSVDFKDRLDELTDIMSDYSNLNFSKKAVVSKDSLNHPDYVAISLNLMRDRLNAQTKKLKRIKSVFNNFNELYIITNGYGEIQFTNNVIEKIFQLREEDFIGKNIKSFFRHKYIKNNYGFDFDRGTSVHGLHKNSVNYEKFDIILKVECSSFNYEDGEVGYIYKVMLLSKELYVDHKKQIKRTKNLTAENRQLLNEERDRNNQKTAILKQLLEVYQDKKSRLDLIETMMYNSIKEVLTPLV